MNVMMFQKCLSVMVCHWEAFTYCLAHTTLHDSHIWVFFLKTSPRVSYTSRQDGQALTILFPLKSESSISAYSFTWGFITAHGRHDCHQTSEHRIDVSIRGEGHSERWINVTVKDKTMKTAPVKIPNIFNKIKVCF